MAFRKKYINEIFGTVLVLSALLSTASAVDCFGKSFHCVNATHFMICVDLGGGVSQSIDDFLIPCPPPTVCQGNNHFECEFPAVTTPSTTLSNVISETTEPWEEIVVTTNTPPKNTSTTKEYSEKYMNTESISSVSEDNLTTDTTIDTSVVTEATSLSDVNSNLNSTEIAPTSTDIDTVIGLNGVESTTANIIASVVENGTDQLQVIHVSENQNVTNETTSDNLVSNSTATESTNNISNNEVNASSVSKNKVGNVTTTIKTQNITSENVNPVTPDTLFVNLSNGTEQPFTTIIDENITTNINLELTTTQPMLSTDGSQNSDSTQSTITGTTLEIVTVPITIGVEQFQKPVFGENLMTESGQNAIIEQSTILPSDILENLSTPLPTTYQSTVTDNNVTSKNVVEEVTIDTIVGTESPATTTYEEKVSIAGYNDNTTEALQINATNGNDMNKNKSNVPSTNDGQVQPTTDTNILQTTFNLTTEQPNAFTMESQRIPSTEQSTINKDNTATKEAQKPVDIESKTTSSQVSTTEQLPTTVIQTTTETQILLVSEPSVTTTKSLKPIEKNANEFYKSTTDALTDVTATNNNPSEFTTKKQKELRVEQFIPNETNPEAGINLTTEASTNLTAEAVTNLTSEAGINLATEAGNTLTTEAAINLTTEAAINSTTEATTKLTSEAGIDLATEAGISLTTEATINLTTEAANDLTTEAATKLTSEAGINLATEAGISLTTEAAINLTTEAVTNLTTEAATKLTSEAGINLATEAGISLTTEAAINLTTEAATNLTSEAAINLKTEAGIHLTTENGVNLTTEAAIDLTTKPSINLTTEPRINLTKEPIIYLTTEASGALPTEAQQSTPRNFEQQTITNIEVTIETQAYSEYTTETQTQLVTEQSIQRNNSPVGGGKATKANILPDENLKPVPEGEQPIVNTEVVSNENSGVFTTVTLIPIYISSERPTTIINDAEIDSKTVPEQTNILATETQKPTKQVGQEEKQSTLATKHTTALKNNQGAGDLPITERANIKKDENILATKYQTQPDTENSTISDSVVKNIDVTSDASVLPTGGHKPIYTGNVAPITSTKSLNTNQGTITEHFSTYTETTIFTTATEKSILAHTEQLNPTHSNDVSDILMTTETSILNQDGILTSSSDQNSFSTNEKAATDNIIIDSAVVTADVAVVQDTVTEQPTVIANENNIKTDLNSYNITNLQENTVVNNREAITENVQSIATITSITNTTTQPTTRNDIADQLSIDANNIIQHATTAFTNNAKANVSDLIKELAVVTGQTENTKTEQSKTNTDEVATTPLNSLTPTEVTKNEIINHETSTAAQITLNLNNGQQKELSINIAKLDSAYAVTTDASSTVTYDINTPVVGKVDSASSNSHVTVVSGSTITELPYLNPITEGLTAESIQNKVENINTIQQPEQVGGQTSTNIIEPVTIHLGTTLVTKSNNVNVESKDSYSTLAAQVFETEATSETTATDKFTSSVKPTIDNFDTKNIASSHQLIKNTGIAIENEANGSPSFSGTSKTDSNQSDVELSPLPSGSVKFDTVITNLNTQGNPDKGLINNVANDHDQQSSTIYQSGSQKPEQFLSQTDDFKPSTEQVNTKVDNTTNMSGIIENVGITFSNQPTTTVFEAHMANRDAIFQQVEATTQYTIKLDTTQTTANVQNENENYFASNPSSNIVFAKTNQAVNSKAENTNTFDIKVGSISNMDTLSTAAVSVTVDNPAQISLFKDKNDQTIQLAVPLVYTHDNLPSNLNINSQVEDNFQKPSQATSDINAENIAVTPSQISHKKSSVAEEKIITNDGSVGTVSVVPITESTTEFTILKGAKKLYSTIGGYFDTPAATTTLPNINTEVNSDISSNLPGNGVQRSTKISANSIHNTESPVITSNDNLLLNTLRPIPTASSVSILHPVPTNVETSTKTSINTDASNTIENKATMSEGTVELNHKIETNAADVNQKLPSESYGTTTSGIKISEETYSSAPSNFHKNVTSDISSTAKNNGVTVETSLDMSQQSPSQNAVNVIQTDAKNMPGQSNKQEVVINLTNTDNIESKTKVGNNSKNVPKYASFGTSNNGTNLANTLGYSSTNTSSLISEKVGLVPNTNEANSSIAKNTSKHNIYQQSNTTVTVNVPKIVPQYINNNNGSSSILNSANTTRDLKKSTIPTRHVAEPVNSTPQHETLRPVIVTTSAPTTKLTLRPAVHIATTTTENPMKQISKPDVVNYNCINGIRGRYSDKDDCRKFYICVGNSQPIVGNCPANTVFSDISKLCTKNLSHCIRENEFKCPAAGRFSDVTKGNVYYICVSYKSHFYRFKFQCQKGLTLNKNTTRCEENKITESVVSATISVNDESNSSKSSTSSNKSSTSSSSTSSKSSTSSSSTSSDSSSASVSSDSSGSGSTSTESSASDGSSSNTDSSSSDSSSSSSDSSSSSSNSDSGNNSDSSTFKSKEKKESKEKPEGKEGDDEEDEVFECEKEGKFPVRNDCRRYYLCKKKGKSEYRRKIKKCESGDVFHKGKKNGETSNESNDSENDSDRRRSTRRQRKGKKREPEERDDDEQEVFQCQREGKFPVPGDCRRYYLCRRNRRSEYRRKIKQCDSDEVFHKYKKKCVDADSYEC